jgi:nucleotide-binding universal stress UspA family protein
MEELHMSDSAINTVLAPTDFSDRSFYAFDLAIKIAACFKAKIIPFHVIPLEQIRVAREIMIEQKFTVPGYSEQELIAKREARIFREFERHFPDYGTLSIRVEPHAALGNPVEKILEAVETYGVDIIVMGTHGRTGINLALIGSVAEKVVRHSPVPVTTVKVQSDTEA